MSQPRPRGSVSDRLAAAAAAALVGRAEERAHLTTLLAPHGPAAVFVHGPGGIGKTTLVTGTLAALPLKYLSLDGRQMEPTVPGALTARNRAGKTRAVVGHRGRRTDRRRRRRHPGDRQLRAAQPARRLDPQRVDPRPPGQRHHPLGGP